MFGSVYVLCFEDDATNWWSQWLKKGCRHCFIVKKDVEASIVIAKNMVGYDFYTVSSEKTLYDIIGKVYATELVTVKHVKQPLFMLNTCTAHCKRMLGINKPFILTPYQLLKYVRKQNGILEAAKTT